METVMGLKKVLLATCQLVGRCRIYVPKVIILFMGIWKERVGFRTVSIRMNNLNGDFVYKPI